MYVCICQLACVMSKERTISISCLSFVVGNYVAVYSIVDVGMIMCMFIVMYMYMYI